MSKCNRKTSRKLAFPKELLLIDSTTVTVDKTRLLWAPYHGERAGIKLHVAIQAENKQPLNVIQSVGSKHDGPMSEGMSDKEDGQSFVIRLRDNVHLEKPRALRRQKDIHSSVICDITCQLGTAQCRSENRHRVVIFQDFEGREIRVVTDLMQITAEQITQMYKARWQIEVFFRWIKQHLNIPTLFGTTENDVYGQLFAALMVYVLLKWLFDASNANASIPLHTKLSFVQFSRLLVLNRLPSVWIVKIQLWVQIYNHPGTI